MFPSPPQPITACQHHEAAQWQASRSEWGSVQGRADLQVLDDLRVGALVVPQPVVVVLARVAVRRGQRVRPLEHLGRLQHLQPRAVQALGRALQVRGRLVQQAPLVLVVDACMWCYLTVSTAARACAGAAITSYGQAHLAAASS